MKRILFVVLLLSIIVSAQEEADSNEYKISSEVGGGYSRFFSSISMDNFNKNGYTTSLRFLWQPEHLLAVGVESGYYHLYSYRKGGVESEFGKSDVKISMVSLPVLLMFRMRIHENVHLYAGSGILVLYNQGEMFGDKFNSSEISIADHVGASYSWMVSSQLRVGAEFKYTYIFKLEDAYVSMQLFAAYNLFSY